MTSDVIQAPTGNEDDYGFGGVTTDTATFVPPVKTPKEHATIYDALRDEFNRPAESGPVTLSVPNRDGLSVVYDADIDYDTIQTYYNKSKDKKGKLDVMRLSLIVLQNTMLGLVLNGEPVIDNEGDPMSIVSQDMLDMLNVRNPNDAIKKLYGSDGHIIATAGKVMEAAGYSYDADDMEDEDAPKF